MKEIYKALALAHQSLLSVAKDAVNHYSKYRYTSSEAMVSRARKALLDHALVAGRSGWTYSDISGTADEVAAKVKSRFFLFHTESGEQLTEEVEFPAIAKKGTSLDKAVAASLTTALSYWLRDLLLIPRIDEPISMNSRDDRTHILNQKLGAAK